jgi:hypothetical protein
MTRDELDTMIAELAVLHEAMIAEQSCGVARKAYSAARDRWMDRPTGRGAAPGDIFGQYQDPWDLPPGDRIECRRCGGVSSLLGHPYGCPQTPGRLGEQSGALRFCYCGMTLVVSPEVFGRCCEETPPVPIPGGCAWCGSSLCRVGNRDDLPERSYYTNGEYLPIRHPECLPNRNTYGSWAHPRCVDEYALSRARDHDIDLVESRRRKRAIPIGVVPQ